MIRLLIVLILSSLFYENTSYGEKVESGNTIYGFIMKYECPNGPKMLTAYWDHKGWSIGCWTPSYEWEKISREEAYKRFYRYVDKTMVVVKRDFPKAEGDRLIALVSLAGNNWTCYTYHRRYWLSRDQWLRCDKVRKDGKLVPEKGLTIRRAEEANMYF